MRDAVTRVFSIVAPVHTQKSLAIMRSRAILTAHLVGVRGIQFALQFPEEVGEFRARGDTLNQGSVLRVDCIPVDARHVRRPELLALQTPGLGKHLLPLRSWLYRHLDAAKIDPAAFATSAFIIGPGRLF